MILAIAGVSVLHAQVVTVSGRVELVGGEKGKSSISVAPSVVWLTPLANTGEESSTKASSSSPPPRLVQKNKSFSPHLLVVPVGAAVEFPNHDPFFHNVFSLFEGKRFDLGLYEAGSARLVHFDRPGISYIFCNIHPEMSAVVIALDTPWYAVSDAAGSVTIPDVPSGRYMLHAWSEKALPAALQSLSREVTISPDSSSLGTVRLAEKLQSTADHKNKYGREYDPASPSSPIYPQP